MSAAKTTVATQQQPKSGVFAMLAIPVCFILAVLVYKFIFGNANNFIDGNTESYPVASPSSNHYFGVIYKGGFIVPLLLTSLFTVIVVSIERFLTLGKSSWRRRRERLRAQCQRFP